MNRQQILKQLNELKSKVVRRDKVWLVIIEPDKETGLCRFATGYDDTERLFTESEIDEILEQECYKGAVSILNSWIDD